MAYKASDGSEFSNLPRLKQHERRLSANAPSPKLKLPTLAEDTEQDTDQDQDQDSDQTQDITSDPEAMECIEKLKTLGYTKEQVDEAFDSDDNQSSDDTQSSDDNSPAIPGLR
jgi:hypothetical protein